jgi:hypothetical protein
MGCVFAEADVCNNEQLWEALLDEADTGHDGTFWIIGSGTKSIFNIWSQGNAEEYNGSKTFANKRFEMSNEFIETAAVLAWQRWNWSIFVIVVCNKKRVDKHRL